MYSVTSGRVDKPYKVVVYGPEGIGKSTFASRFPNPLFSDTEGGTARMDVRRITPPPTSWAMLMQQAEFVRDNPDVCGTYVVDTADWAERLCQRAVCDRAKKSGIEEFGYGKGYTYAGEEFGKLLNVLTEVVECGRGVVVTAHAAMRKFEQPDEMGAYDRWEMKMHKIVSTMIKEWADMVLFVNYKTVVVTQDSGKAKAQGGRRVMYTTHMPCWDAKNRDGLPDEVPFEYESIRRLIEGGAAPTVEDKTVSPEAPAKSPEPTKPDLTPEEDDGIPAELVQLMKANGVRVEEIQYAVTQKGYYPRGTLIRAYEPGFIKGVLIGAWDQVLKMVQDNRADLPF